MIAVIADDITGGAEIAGMGLRYGLRVLLSTSSDIPCPEVDLWVISTDSRSMYREEAFVVTVRTVDNLKSKGIDDIFKKTDSVLRGHITAELVAQLKAEGKKKVVLCPANPQSGRVIINGTYYIDGIPLHETGFSKDPDFPITSSNVNEIVGTDFLGEYNFTIVNAATDEDLNQAARLKNHETVIAGSAAFFKAYLESMNLIPLTDGVSISTLKNILFVRGSAFAKSRDEVERTSANGANVTYLSPLIIDTPDYQSKTDNYASELISVLKKGENAILAIGEPVLQGKEAAGKIKDMMSDVVRNVLSAINVNELVIEGGATTSAILGKLNYIQFVPTFEYAPGVVRMKVRAKENMYLTIKPGSYQFPEQVWNFKKINVINK
jgi:uncharacterized protein YgbK (DUF1537 family)